ncbi:MAG: zinc ribbon domain-containing protein [Clostridia bacterium]|nr:zinc ribbon domain-containing protein [Clostridia bacterium]
MARYCRNCGNLIEDGEAFCANCGTRIEPPKPERAAAPAGAEGEITGKRVTENVYLCADGKYRWYYELPMMKNPTILFTVWKVLGISFGIVFLFVAFIDACDSVDFAESLWATAKIFLILVGIFFVISLIAYFIVAATYGFKYIVLFEMDDEQIVHIQCAKQFKKAQAIGWITMIAGALTGKPAMVGLGLQGAVKNSSTSDYGTIKKLRFKKRRDVIYISHGLSKNQIYAYPADYDFVADYIKSRCKNAKVK